MSDKEILYLKELQETQGVYYIDCNGHILDILLISLSYKDSGCPDDIPEPVAFLSGGGYVALWNCELSDFCSIKRLSI